MRAGADRLLARVVQVFGAAQAHHGYLFANARGTRIMLLVHDGFGVWCAARRLNAGRFALVPATTTSPISLSLTNAQFDALVQRDAARTRSRNVEASRPTPTVWLAKPC